MKVRFPNGQTVTYNDALWSIIHAPLCLFEDQACTRWVRKHTLRFWRCIEGSDPCKIEDSFIPSQSFAI